MKFTSNKGELTLNKTPNITLARFDSQTYRKWNRILASISCILIFLLLLGIVVRSIWNERNNQNCTSTSQLLNYGQDNKCSFSANERECTIKCLQIYDFDYLNSLLKNSENQMKTCKLSIEIDDSRNLNIIKNWLPSDNNMLTLNHIEFYRSSINIIDTNAFFGILFDTIEKIEFKFTTIKLIKEKSFETQRLNELNFQDSEVLEIEPGYASSFNHLHTLQYIRCSSDPKILENLTVYTKFPQLSTLDLRFANYWALEKEMFAHLKELQLVFFEDSNIMSIGSKTFAMNTKLAQLNLKNTNMQYIPENIFGNNSRLNKLILSNNQWICNCSLQWLKDTWMNTDYQTESFPVCDKPNEFQGLSFNEVDFCSGEIIVPTSTPGSTSTDDNEETPDVLTVLCSNDGEIHIGDDKQLHSTIEQNLKNREIIDFDVFESNGDVVVKLDRLLEDYCLLWTNNNRELIFDNNNVIDKKNGTGCFTRINQTNIVKLEPENFYTICLINGTNKEIGTLISPFDCKAIKISLFSKRYLLGIIITIVITTVFLLSLIIIIIYKRKFSIQKRKPKQMDTLNRIIHHDDAHNAHVQWPFPTNNIDTVSYALDRSTTFSIPRSQNRDRSRLARSLSESSFYSHETIRSGETGSYVSPPEPSAMELLNWKMACIREKYFREHESPPPLPPYPIQKNETNLDRSHYHSQGSSSSTPVYSHHK